MQLKKQLGIIIAGILIGAAVLSVSVSQGVTLVAQVMTPMDISPTIVIDPGHGGEDGGAVSCTGALESGINLDVSQKLGDLLTLLGMRVKMTRTEDVSLHASDAVTVSEKKVSDLKNRVKMVAETNCPILISIHQNMFSEEKYSGAQVFYADSAQSRELAELTQNILKDAIDPTNHREAKKSLNVYLMNKIRCTGILIECGFLSNRKEEEKLRSDGYQKQLACAIASGLTVFLNNQSVSHE